MVGLGYGSSPAQTPSHVLCYCSAIMTA